MKVAISLIAIFYSDGGAQSIHTIPLDAFVSGGAETVIAVVARMEAFQALTRLALCSGVVSLLRDDSAYVCPDFGEIPRPERDWFDETHR